MGIQNHGNFEIIKRNEMTIRQCLGPGYPKKLGFLDRDADPQKYADPRIRIQGAKYQLKLQQKNFTLKTKI